MSRNLSDLAWRSSKEFVAFERLTCEIWEAATGEMYVRGSHGTFMINIAVGAKKIWNSHWTFTTMFGKSVVALFATRGYDCLILPVRLPVLTTLLAFIAHHLLHFLVRKSDCLQGQTGRQQPHGIGKTILLLEVDSNRHRRTVPTELYLA